MHKIMVSVIDDFPFTFNGKMSVAFKSSNLFTTNSTNDIFSPQFKKRRILALNKINANPLASVSRETAYDVDCSAH